MLSTRSLIIIWCSRRMLSDTVFLCQTIVGYSIVFWGQNLLEENSLCKLSMFWKLTYHWHHTYTKSISVHCKEAAKPFCPMTTSTINQLNHKLMTVLTRQVTFLLHSNPTLALWGPPIITKDKLSFQISQIVFHDSFIAPLLCSFNTQITDGWGT